MIQLNFPRSTDIAQKETLYIPPTLEIIVQGLYFIQKGQKKKPHFPIRKKKKENAWLQSYSKADKAGDPDFVNIHNAGITLPTR